MWDWRWGRPETVGRRVAKTNEQSNPAGASRSRWEPIEIRFNVRILHPVEARLDAEGVCFVAHASAAARSRTWMAFWRDFASNSPIMWKPRTLARGGLDSVTTLCCGKRDSMAFA